jgi:DNA-binding MarR family transcriptional regulator
MGLNMEKHIYELIFSIKQKCLSTEESIQKELRLSPSEFSALIELQPDEEILGNTLAERLNLSVSRSSRIVSKLMDNDYVTIQVNSNDRRTVSISLTQNGKKMKSKIENHLNKCEQKIKSFFSEKKIQNIKSALLMLDEALSQ